MTMKVYDFSADVGIYSGSVNELTLDPPRPTASHDGLDARGALSSSQHEVTNLNSIRVGSLTGTAETDGWYSKRRGLVHLRYALTASALLPEVPSNYSTYVNSPRHDVVGTFSPTSGSFRYSFIQNPSEFEIFVEEYGKILDVKFHVEFVTDQRRNTVSDTITLNPTLDKFVVAVRPPTNRPSFLADPLWNSTNLSKGDVNGRQSLVGGVYTAPDPVSFSDVGIFKDTFVLWNGAAISDDFSYLQTSFINDTSLEAPGPPQLIHVVDPIYLIPSEFDYGRRFLSLLSFRGISGSFAHHASFGDTLLSGDTNVKAITSLSSSAVNSFFAVRSGSYECAALLEFDSSLYAGSVYNYNKSGVFRRAASADAFSDTYADAWASSTLVMSNGDIDRVDSMRFYQSSAGPFLTLKSMSSGTLILDKYHSFVGSLDKSYVIGQDARSLGLGSIVADDAAVNFHVVYTNTSDTRVYLDIRDGIIHSSTLLDDYEHYSNLVFHSSSLYLMSWDWEEGAFLHSRDLSSDASWTKKAITNVTSRGTGVYFRFLNLEWTNLGLTVLYKVQDDYTSLSTSRTGFIEGSFLNRFNLLTSASSSIVDSFGTMAKDLHGNPLYALSYWPDPWSIFFRSGSLTPFFDIVTSNYRYRYTNVVYPKKRRFSFDGSRDMRCTFHDGAKNVNPMNISVYEHGKYPSPSSSSLTYFGSYNPLPPNLDSNDFFGDVGRSSPWFMDSEVHPLLDAGNNPVLKSYSYFTGSDGTTHPTSSFVLSDVWTQPDMFPTQGMQLGPYELQPVHPILDDVGCDSGGIIGVREGLRGQECHGSWKLLIGKLYNDDIDDTLQSGGFWFRNFVIELLIETQSGKQPSQSQKNRSLYSVSGSFAWEGSQKKYFFSNLRRTESVSGISAKDVSLVAVSSILTGSLSDNQDVVETFLANEFGTPHIPDSFMTASSSQTFTDSDVAASKERLAFAIGSPSFHVLSPERELERAGVLTPRRNLIEEE